MRVAGLLFAAVVAVLGIRRSQAGFSSHAGVTTGPSETAPAAGLKNTLTEDTMKHSMGAAVGAGGSVTMSGAKQSEFSKSAAVCASVPFPVTEEKQGTFFGDPAEWVSDRFSAAVSFCKSLKSLHFGWVLFTAMFSAAGVLLWPFTKAATVRLRQFLREILKPDVVSILGEASSESEERLKQKTARRNEVKTVLLCLL